MKAKVKEIVLGVDFKEKIGRFRLLQD